eukprot:2245399-Amphidinium_carterae.1
MANERLTLAESRCARRLRRSLGMNHHVREPHNLASRSVAKPQHALRVFLFITFVLSTTSQSFGVAKHLRLRKTMGFGKDLTT